MLGSCEAVAGCSPKRSTTKKLKKNSKKDTSIFAELEADLTQFLYSGLEWTQTPCGGPSDAQEEDRITDSFGDEIDQFPCEWEFYGLYDWKLGKIARKKSRRFGTLLTTTTSKRKHNAICLKSLNIKPVKDEAARDIFLHNSKRWKSTKVHLIRKEIKKVAKTMREEELKNKNVERRLELNHTPRRGSVEQPTKTLPTSSYTSSYNQNSRNNLRREQHVLRRDNAEKFGSEDLLSKLISIQDREITPEDFDLLLQLDSFVEEKTVPKTVIDALRTEEIDTRTYDLCLICREDYEMGQLVKYLNCGHFFHSSCIRTWLTVNSNKCPLDSQEVC